MAQLRVKFFFFFCSLIGDLNGNENNHWLIYFTYFHSVLTFKLITTQSEHLHLYRSLWVSWVLQTKKKKNEWHEREEVP